MKIKIPLLKKLNKLKKKPPHTQSQQTLSAPDALVEKTPQKNVEKILSKKTPKVSRPLHRVVEPTLRVQSFWSGLSPEPPHSTLSYLVTHTPSKQSLLIDPDRVLLGTYLSALERQGLTLVGVLDTHLHNDHASAGRYLVTLFGEDTCDYWAPVGAGINSATAVVDEQSGLSIGEQDVQFIETPGHTPHCLSVRVGPHLFTGDTLLIGGCGRCDQQRGSAHALYDSLQKLETLPGDVLLHPGHDMEGKDTCRLDEARRLIHPLTSTDEITFAQMLKTYYDSVPGSVDADYYSAHNQK